MNTSKNVFIATSLDGYIADAKGGIDWLHAIPNPTQDDMGYAAFTAGMDAMIMGRNTFETVAGFDVDWPYQQPVFVLSNTMKKVPEGYEDKIELINGPLTSVLKTIHQKGHHHLYIDGGRTIQHFLAEDLIDEMIITVIPVLLGAGTPLFGNLERALNFECLETTHCIGKIAQNKYIRKR